MSRRMLALLLLGMAFSTPVAADEVVPLQLDGAVRYALANRLEVTQAELGVAAAETDIKQQKGLYLPTLDATAGLYKQQTNDDFTGIEINGEVNGAPVSVQVDRTLPRYQGNTGLEAKLNLYAGGAHRAQIDQAKARLGKVEAEALSTKRQVALDAARTLVRWRQARIKLDLARKRQDVAHKSAKISRVQHASGAESDIELQRAELALEREAISINKAEREQAQAWREYLKAINHPVVAAPKQVTPDWRDACAVLDTTFPPGIEPEVLVAQSEVAEAKQKLRQGKASFRPEVNLLARYNTFDRADRDFTDALDDFSVSESMIGFQMNWNLYSGGRDRYLNEQAAIRYEQAKYDVLVKEKDALNRQQKLTGRLQSARDEQRLAEQELKLQRAMQKIRDTEYKHGDISELAHMQAELETASAQTALNLRRLDVSLAQLEVRLGLDGSRM